MNITHLPKDLKIDTSAPVQLFDYRNPVNIQKTKINLSKNTISFLRTGVKEVFGDDKTAHINAQQFLIMKSGHRLMTEKISDENRIYRSMLLFFDDAEAIQFLEKHQLYKAVKKSKKSFYIFKYDEYISGFVKSLEGILRLPKNAQQKMLKTKFEEIMLYLTHQNGPGFLNTIVQSVDDKVSRLIQIVDNNKLTKLSLEELAFLSKMSVSTFKREFKNQYQQTPMKWFNDQRLQHTALLLKTNRKRPIELYEEAGYENFSNFIQAFKKKFGTTPKDYQNQS
ncbi:MAG: helix-turn-helix domain-containing protein [Saprospiraceae bacterium]